MRKEKGKELKELIKELAITKQLNFLIGSGVSFPAIPLMGLIQVEDEKERNDKLLEEIIKVSKQLLAKNDYSEDVKTTYDNYYNFLSQVIQLLNQSNSRQVSRSVNIFTTNYDLFIEKVIDALSADNRFVFNDGANGYFERVLDISNYNKVVAYKGLNDNYINEIPAINMIKPHGSVNWEKQDEKIIIRHFVLDDCIVVKPTGIEGEETFLNNYFHDMLRVFQLELDKPQSVLFVIGFSFQDKHIAKMFLRALQNPELMVYVFCFNKDDKTTILKNLGIEKCKNNLCILSSGDFGNDENGTFTIKDLTNIFEGNKND